jgi:flagellar hook-basal body complex protein FliE
MSNMSIDAINMMQRIHEMGFEASGQVGNDPTSSVGGTFRGYLDKALDAVNNEQTNAHALQTKYIKDDPSVSLSKVMIQMQKAQISLSALVTVRDKILDGYKTILNETV